MASQQKSCSRKFPVPTDISLYLTLSRLMLGQVASVEPTNDAVTEQSGKKSLGIVITGGSKGLGFALARKFLKSNDRVVICGRDEKTLANAIAVLQQENAGVCIDGIACDVANSRDVERLAAFAGKRLGVIDRWLNNAGEVTAKKLLADVEADEIIRVSGTNVVGSLLCCREAIRYMRKQPLSVLPIYHIFNMGFSQWGGKFTKSACTHKATKFALTQLTESLCEELKSAGMGIAGNQTFVTVTRISVSDYLYSGVKPTDCFGSVEN